MNDADTDNAYKLSVSATDAAGNSSAQALTVTVTDDDTETFTGIVGDALTYNYKLQRSTGVADDVNTQRL